MLRAHRRTALAAISVIALVSSAVVTLPGASQASDATMRMSFSNIVNGPLDAVVSPYTGGYILVTNLRDVEDSRGVRVTYAVPGFVWLVGLEFFGGGIRTITGGLEMLPAVMLFPFDQDINELFDPVDTASAIVVDYENPLADNDKWYVRWNPVATFFSIPLKFGLNYTKSDY